MALSPVDLASVAAGIGGFVIYGQDINDRSGHSVATAGDINGDGFADLIIGARYGGAAGNAKPNAGESYVVFGSAAGSGASIDLTSIAAGIGGFVIYGQDAGDTSGFSVASAGDINGDGFADLIVGAPGAGGAGKSYVVFGSAAGFGASIDLATIAAGIGGFVINGQNAGDSSGLSVASAGDINGDGFADLIIGAYHAGAAGNAKALAGDSYVVFGKAGGFGASIDLSDVAAGTGGFVIYGQNAGDEAGRSVASAGDINGDGYADLVIGALRGDAAGNAKTDAGNSYVVFGHAGGFPATIDLATIATGVGGFVIYGRYGGDKSGFSVASAGDINGDGFADLIIGAVGGGAAGNAKPFAGDSYVVFGHAGGFGASIDLANIAAGIGGFVIHGQEAGDKSGYSVASAGDINGDGFDDLIIGTRLGAAAGDAKPYAGDSYVVFGHAGGFGASIDLATIAAGVGGFVIYGQRAGDRSARSVAAAGDVNGDGFADLIIGAYGAGAAGNAKSNAGNSYVLFGGNFTNAVMQIGGAGGGTLTGTAAADDIVGGSGNDIIVGNGGADVLLGGAGDDVIHISDLNFQRVDGGSGTNTLVLDGGGMTLDLTAIPHTKLRNFERIDLTGSGGNSLILTALAVVNLSDTSNALRVDGNGGDHVSLSGEAWVHGAATGGYVTYTHGQASVQIGAGIAAPCFAAGSRILTARGEVAVEDMTVGDLVPVLIGRFQRHVRWIGHRRMRLAGHSRPWDVQPVRVCAHAFGAGIPHSDLRLSPDHGVFAAGVLIPVRALINGVTIVQEEVVDVTYYHAELADASGAATHDVLLAQGLPAESFLDTGNRGAFANGGPAVMTHPDFARRIWTAATPARLVLDGPELVEVRTQLLAQAAALGHAMTTDPDLHLLVDGVVVRPNRAGAEYVFVLPKGPREMRFVSRTTVPAQVTADTNDTRRLGVAISRIVLDGVPIALDDPRLAAGWHAAEPGWRWTTGNAVFTGVGGGVVRITALLMERYWLPATGNANPRGMSPETYACSRFSSASTAASNISVVSRFVEVL